ncbi:hypothetical protein [Curtanaerobium respiraculi]|uniref:hypothetical protein n=1 Tax=Curtanaerobium respiraculi TaxID=2949669 RepID=UPI0024B38745|nr:hypothetical protein [Curtanaerobium respiraculi]
MSGHVAPLPGGPLVAAPSVSGLGDAATAGLFGSGTVLAAAGCALFAILWCEYLSRVSLSRAMFYLAMDAALVLPVNALMLCMDEFGYAVTLLTCVALSWMGLRRCNETLRGHDPFERPAKPAVDTPSRKTIVALMSAVLIYTACTVVVKTIPYGRPIYLYATYILLPMSRRAGKEYARPSARWKGLARLKPPVTPG